MLEFRSLLKESIATLMYTFQSTLLHSGGRSSVGRVPDCDSGCRGFEPHRSPQKILARPNRWAFLCLAPPAVSYHVVMSTQPTHLDWSTAPAGWDWAAQDEDGRWFWYSVKPILGIGGGVWRAPSRAQCLAIQGAPNAQWYDTLQARPGP